MAQERTPVLIVGAGLTGLSAAAFLGRHGVRATLVERRATALAHPRARAVNPRTVELYRGLGIEPVILDACTYELGDDSLLVRAGSLAGPELHRAPLAAPRTAPQDGRAPNRESGREGGRADLPVSPCQWATISQDRLEAIVRARAEELGAEVRFGSELRGFTDRGELVEAVVADLRTGRERTMLADYLIAADGHRSPVRDRLGIPVGGPGSLGHTATFVFQADLGGPLRGRRIDIANLDSPAPGTVLLRHDAADGWVLSIPYHPDRGERLTDFGEDRCVEAVRAAAGAPGLAVTVLPQLPDGTTVLGYEISAQIADRYRHGRVLLAGDAAHVMPPSGALGASTGIQDAHNLAWKLAEVLAGRAGPGLLDTYEAERLPVARLTLAQALHQMRTRTGRSLPAPEVEETVHPYEAVIFGYRYDTTASEDLGASEGSGGSGDAEGAAATATACRPEELRGEPGTRAPHVELVSAGRRISSLDLYGPGHTLIAAPKGTDWAEAAGTVSGGVGAGLRTYVLDDSLRDPDGLFCDLHGLEPDGAVLVRPDGFVAWRSPGGSDRPADVLHAALTRTRRIAGR